MPTYLLSVFSRTDPGPFGPYPSREAMAQAMDDTGVFNELLQREGHFVYAGGLQPPRTARVVDGGSGIVTEGPYLTGDEQLGGFWIIEAADLDEATRLAEAGSRACRGVVEVRPFPEGE